MNESAQTFGDKGTQTDASGGGSDIPVASIMSGATSMFGFMTEKKRSQAMAGGMRQQAAETETNAAVEKINADATVNALQERLAATLAQNTAALSTAGVDPTSGSARIVQEQSINEANVGFFQTNMNSRIRVSALKRQAAQLRSDANQEIKDGKTRAQIGLVTSLAKFASGGAG